MAILKVNHGGNTPFYSGSTTKKYYDENALYDVITYCCDPGKAISGLIGGFGINVQYAAAQMDGLARAYRQADGIRLRHMELSLAPKERISAKRLFRIAYDVAQYYGWEYQILYAVHEDTPNKHVHFVMNTVSYRDGHKYAGKREDYYRFRNHVAAVLEPYGFNVWWA